MTKYGKSPWIDRFPASRVPSYPRQRGSFDATVVIVGGGLAGCTTAYAFAAAGVDVVLLEAARIGHGSTGSALGWISEEPGTSFLEVERALGLRAARDAFQSWRRAALDLAALLRRLDVKCSLEPHGAATVALTPEQVARLKREQKERSDAGLEGPFMNTRAVKTELALDGLLAVRYKGSAALDPYRACVGIAAAAVARGARLFERSVVNRITFTRKAARVFTADGAIRAARVVVATGAPTSLTSSLARHFWYRSSYLALTEPVPGKIRSQLGRRALVIRDGVEPPHLVRWIDDERLLVSGADGESPPPRRRDRVIAQRTGQLMYELSTLYPDISGILPSYGWDAAYVRTADGLPYIGPHRNFPHQLFAFGDASGSATGAYLASRILLRYFLGATGPADAPFAFTRYGR